MDFWESLAARTPSLDYETLRERFSWDLPHSYNMGVDACDRHTWDRGRIAIIHDREDGAVEKWTYRELKKASDRFANALTGLGVEQGDRVAGQTECNLVLSNCGAIMSAKPGSMAAPSPVTASPWSMRRETSSRLARWGRSPSGAPTP